ERDGRSDRHRHRHSRSANRFTVCRMADYCPTRESRRSLWLFGFSRSLLRSLSRQQGIEVEPHRRSKVRVTVDGMNVNKRTTMGEQAESIRRMLESIPKARVTRRGFVMTALTTGFALAVRPISAQTVTTDAD